MTILSDYAQFSGRHWETGSVHNALAYQRVTAPHTGQPISEALLLGISGGAAFGYFTFQYTDYPPILALLTRNTFDPFFTMLERLAVPQDVLQTASAAKGLQNLLEVLEGGRPAIIWADMATLPYYDLPENAEYWAMWPMVCYGIDGDTAYLADRANVPLTVPVDVLQAARARVKKDKFRVMALDTPDLDKLPAAVSKGIWQCISLFTETPPRGKRENFGLAGLEFWSKMLVNTRNKQSWARFFEPGARLWSALVGDRVQPGVFTWIDHGDGNAAERGMYADFLEEAAVLLNKPGLNDAAALFRQSEKAWAELARLALPDAVPLLKQARDLLAERRKLFVEQGATQLDRVHAINDQIADMRATASREFPMDAVAVTDFRAGLAAQVDRIRSIEQAAVECLQSGVA